jgi:hypothetical protein
VITIQVGQLVNSAAAIKNVLAAKLPVKTAYHMSRIAKAFNKELETYEEQRNRLIVELGEADEKGNTQVTEANKPEFFKQLNELLVVELKVDLDPVKVDALGDKAEVAAQDLLACESFITE